jgi:hypothetical protein
MQSSSSCARNGSNHAFLLLLILATLSLVPPLIAQQDHPNVSWPPRDATGAEVQFLIRGLLHAIANPERGVLAV